MGDHHEVWADVVHRGGEPEDQDHEPGDHGHHGQPGVARQEAERQDEIVEDALGPAVCFGDLAESTGIRFCHLVSVNVAISHYFLQIFCDHN